MKDGDEKGIKYGLFFQKEDVHSTQDLIKEIMVKYQDKIKILPVVKNINFENLDDFFRLGVERICFETQPAKVIEELNGFVEYNEKTKKDNSKKPYIINFYESLGSFFIDISGELKKEKLMALKLMFQNYLNGKINKLKGVVYIFNNAEDESLVFSNIWALFRIWHEIGFDYKKIFYLTTSEMIIKRLGKYIKHLGVSHYTSLLEIVKILYPEKANEDEMKIFEFAASLLENQNKKSSG
jgi:hypothetical protein